MNKTLGIILIALGLFGLAPTLPGGIPRGQAGGGGRLAYQESDILYLFARLRLCSLLPAKAATSAKRTMATELL